MALSRAHLAAWTAALLAGWPADARAAAAPPAVPLEVRAEGVVVTGTFKGPGRSRYQLTPPAKGTLVISLQAIHGASPRMLLRNAAGRIIRRDRNGQLWTRSPAGEPLVLELYARPGAGDAQGVYQLRTILDVDRPREERDRVRPARPGDIITVSKNGQRIERVLFDGIQADFKDHGANLLVTVPAFARSGTLELFTEGGRAHAATYALVGAEPPAADIESDSCARAGNVGCIELTLAPSVGSAWLKEIARVVDADIVAHSQKSGAVLLKVRLTSSEGFALATLSAMPGVRAARQAIPDRPR
jgi:hypothetical protein